MFSVWSTDLRRFLLRFFLVGFRALSSLSLSSSLFLLNTDCMLPQWWQNYNGRSRARSFIFNLVPGRRRYSITMLRSTYAKLRRICNFLSIFFAFNWYFLWSNLSSSAVLYTHTNGDFYQSFERDEMWPALCAPAQHIVEVEHVHPNTFTENMHESILGARTRF